jgi:serine protease inhibitor
MDKRIVRLIGLCLIIGFGLFLGMACERGGDEPQPFSLPPEATELISSDNQFGLNLFKGVLEEAEARENVMISPLSVSLALSMTLNGAEGNTRDEMEEAMEMSGLSQEQINELNLQLVNALLAHDPNVVLEIANSIWYRDDYTVKPDFIQVNQQYYDAEVSALDFSDPGTIDVINSWVSTKTHDKIEEIVKEINPQSFMFLINAIYFKGAWRTEFDEKDTYDGDFQVNENTVVKVPMMSAELDINTMRNDMFSAVELPYGKGNWSMFILMPDYDNTLDDVVSELNGENWSSWLESFTPTSEVNIHIPKFTFEFESSLKESLIALGMQEAFSSAADFSGILEGGGILISDVKHKTFIEVNEKGTEAAAVTSVEMELTSAGNYFYANRPFLFVIAEKSSNTIMFIGRLVYPEE